MHYNWINIWNLKIQIQFILFDYNLIKIIIWEIVFEQKKNKLALNFNPGLALISLQIIGPNFTILNLEPIYLLNKQESTDQKGKVTTPPCSINYHFSRKTEENVIWLPHF